MVMRMGNEGQCQIFSWIDCEWWSFWMLFQVNSAKLWYFLVSFKSSKFRVQNWHWRSCPWTSYYRSHAYYRITIYSFSTFFVSFRKFFVVKILIMTYALFYKDYWSPSGWNEKKILRYFSKDSKVPNGCIPEKEKKFSSIVDSYRIASYGTNFSNNSDRRACKRVGVPIVLQLFQSPS